jgi:ANTH domain
LLQSVIYLVFVDLLQIYQSYYVLITVMLEKFEEMSLKDAKRAFIIYLNFVKINKEIRKMASTIIADFHIKIDIAFYDIDTKVVEALKMSIETKEREKADARSQ